MKSIIISFKRALRLGWKNFSREIGLSFVSVFVLVITVTLVSSIFLLRGISEVVIDGIKDRADITIDFEVMVGEEKILEIKEEIGEKFEINEMEYISREEAKSKFIERFGDSSAIMDSLEEVGNPFPASINIKAGDVHVYEEISRFLEQNYPELVYEVDFYGRKEIIESIFLFTERAKSMGIAVSAILGIVAILLVFNTVKLAIYGMKEEIRIMGLVGSSNMFIKGSFIIQGAITGFIAALASFIIFLILLFLASESYVFNVNIRQYLLESAPLIALIQLLTGVFLGTLSSLLSAGRYLK